MISRVIEAKPEDMRAFIEEAAGISKYKERARRPRTASRTRENLERLRTCATRSTSRSGTCSGRRRRRVATRH
jgi:chromosome segregation ATPase